MTERSDEDKRETTLNGIEETESFLPVPETVLKKQDSVSDCRNNEQQKNYKEYGFIARLMVDLPFRRRVIYSCMLCWAIVGAGWAAGQLGPSFPDIRNLINQDIQSATWIFSVYSIGLVAGSFIAGFLYKRVNNLLALFVSVSLMAATATVLPWCPSLGLMIAVRIIGGLGGGMLETIANAEVAAIWDEEGRPFMQALHFTYGFGGILSPLATQPFLSEKSCKPDTGSSNITGEQMSSKVTGTTVSVVEINTTDSTAGCLEVYGETRVHYAFIITGCFLMVCALPFLVKFLLKQDSLKMKADKSHMKRPAKLPLPLKSTFVTLLCLLLYMYAAVEDSYASFLMTFCIQYLHWTKDQGSYASSLYWLTFAIGRFSGIFLVKWFTPSRLILSFILFLVCSFVGFLVASITMTVEAVWVFIFLIGWSMSIICPCIYSWTEEVILEVTGIISSMFTIALAVGLVINPVVIGYLIKIYGQISFPYLLLVQCISCLVLYIVIEILLKYSVRPKRCIEIEVEMSTSKQS